MDTDQRKLLRGLRGLDIIGALHGRSLKLKGHQCEDINPPSRSTPRGYIYI